MANKKVSQLVSKPSVLVTDLFPIADPTTGQLFKTTISALGTAIGSGVSSVNTLVGAVVLDTDDIQELASPTNRWFTDTRARAALSASSPLAYNSSTGVFSLPQANGSTNGFLSSADWTTFNAKQPALSGTGFVKISGTTISYDNSTYLTGSSTSGYVTFWNGANSLTGFSGFTYNTDTQLLTVQNITSSGTITGGSFVKTSGTSSQFLKADGSVDSTSYLALSGGNVLIGATSAISTRQELRIGGNASGSRISMGSNGTNYSALVTDSGGNVYLANEFNDSAIRLLMINFNNGVYLSQSATSWTSNSDERMKTDLVAIENATEKVASLRSVIGRYKTDDESKRRPFLIAQDVYSVLPEAVDIDKKTGMMGIQYTEVIPLLVASIKELKSKIETLENK